ncbi:MAG: hypothetical protein H5U02_02185 [Clostridia bacterium]|nr:hypothetical protein [Clostridia bacterium]
MSSNETSIFKVRLSRRAENYLRRTDRSTQKRIAAAIEAIRQSPIGGPRIKALEGSDGDYRYFLTCA